jgi:hypothetical protein
MLLPSESWDYRFRIPYPGLFIFYFCRRGRYFRITVRLGAASRQQIVKWEI